MPPKRSTKKRTRSSSPVTVTVTTSQNQSQSLSRGHLNTEEEAEADGEESSQQSTTTTALERTRRTRRFSPERSDEKRPKIIDSDRPGQLLRTTPIQGRGEAEPVDVDDDTSHANQSVLKSRGNKVTKKSEEDEDVRMMETTNEILLATTSTPLKPHGILTLPQSIASALATDFLQNREIRDLGLTCRWMLVSLNQCEIKEPIELKLAVRRLTRQRLSASTHPLSERTEKFRGHVSRIANLWIGRFRTLTLQASKITVTEVRLLNELAHLVDTRTLILSLFVKHEMLPIHMLELRIERFGLFSLSDFLLPSSLRTIEFVGGIHSRSNPDTRLAQVLKSPNTSQLTALIGMHALSGDEQTTIPSGLAKLTFHTETSTHNQPIIPISNLTLPNSIAFLEIGRWESVTGHYTDLLFPLQLQRLKLSVNIAKGELDLNDWVNLPRSCTNITLHLYNDVQRSIDTVPEVARQLVIKPPTWVTHFQIYRRPEPTPPRLCLAQATLLRSLVIDMIQEIDWPVVSSGPGVLTAIQLYPVDLPQLVSDGSFPDGLLLLDFRLRYFETGLISAMTTHADRFRQLFPSTLNHFILPDLHSSSYMNDVTAQVDALTPVLPVNCLIESSRYGMSCLHKNGQIFREFTTPPTGINEKRRREEIERFGSETTVEFY